MFCKNCGSQILENTNFCPSCGLNFKRVSQKGESINEVRRSYNFDKNTGYNKLQSALLVIGLTDFTFHFFWIIIRLVSDISNSNIYSDYQQILNIFYIINAGIILLLCFLFSTDNKMKLLCLFLSISIFLWFIYTSYPNI